jgi:3-phenylpropionate/trans-cinnamate dioxygenase ferredoxin reductase subunit
MRIVVVGGGLAAARAVEELRAQGHEGSIELFAAEPHLPYERPPLSKGLLLGDQDEASVYVHDEQWYAEESVSLHLGVAVDTVDLDRCLVRAGGQEVAYDRLLLATGATPRRLAMTDGVGARYLRTLEDSRSLKATLRRDQRVVVIGAGWIGLEVAAAARTAGAEVTVVETQALPLLGVLGPEVARVFADVHRSHGVDLRLRATIGEVTTAGDGTTRLGLGDGSELTADVLVVGVGVTPDVDLARSAGLDVDDGVLVDARLRTSDPHVYAAGDIANQLHPVLGRRVRVEHWDTAAEQGRTVARNMLGADEDYTRQPYFFTDQYDLGMEYVGSIGTDGYDEVVVRGERPGSFTAFWLSEDRVLAGMHVNDWDAIGPVRALVGSRVPVDRLRDGSIDLADLAAVVPG